MKQFHYTYLIINNKNGHYYIGKHSTTNIDDCYMGSGKLIIRAMKRYGKENFTKTIFSYHDTEDECLKHEEALVAMHINDPDCYNLANGGYGFKAGCKVSKETRVKISKSMLGRKITDKARANRLNNRNAIEKPVCQIDKLTGCIINEFQSAREAYRYVSRKETNGASAIGGVCRGERKSAYGYFWEYKNK